MPGMAIKTLEKTQKKLTLLICEIVDSYSYILKAVFGCYLDLRYIRH